MISIDRVEAVLVDVPTIRPHVLAMVTMHRQTLCLVKIHCSDGTIGIGEGTTIGGLSYGEESPEGMKLAVDTYFAPLLAKCDANRPAIAMDLLSKSIVGNHFAKCAIETALYDAFGQRVGLPLSELLGGRLRDALPVLWVLASGDTGKDIAEAEEMLSRRRHSAFKLKIGKRDLAEDVQHVAEIKRALGDRASIRVDVNQAWDETTAVRGVEMLADAGIDLVEQPLARTNRAGMARLVARSRVPIMADEALRGPFDANDFVVRHAANVFAVKIEQCAGLFAAKRVQAIADAAGIGLYGGTMLEAGVGTVAAAHVFATFPNLSWGTELFGPLLLCEELLEQPLEYSDFSLNVPSGPGLGIRLNEDKLKFLSRGAKERAAISLPRVG